VWDKIVVDRQNSRVLSHFTVVLGCNLVSRAPTTKVTTWSLKAAGVQQKWSKIHRVAW